MKDNDLTDSRVKSILALLALLDMFIQNPDSDEVKLLKSYLKSQRSLASFTDRAKGIVGCSLNTMKRLCVNVPGGFSAIDSRRRQALLAANKRASQSVDLPATSKRSLQVRALRLRELLDISSEDLLLLTRMFEKSLHQGRLYALESNSPAIIERCRREQAELRDMMSLRQTVGNPLRSVLSES